MMPIELGSSRGGEQHPSAKFSDAKIEEVKTLLTTTHKNVSIRKLAKELKMGKTTLQKLRKHGTRSVAKAKSAPADRFTHEEIREIRGAAKTETQVSIAKRYKKSESVIGDIVRKRTYKHVMDDNKKQQVFDRDQYQKRLQKASGRLLAKTVQPSASDCWEWVGATKKSGYGKMTWQGKTYGAHQVSWMLHHNDGKSQPEHLEVRHLCPQNKNCVNPAHLEIGTRKQNAQDRVVHGTQFTGERHPSAIVSYAVRKEIIDKCSTKPIVEAFHELKETHDLTYRQIVEIQRKRKRK